MEVDRKADLPSQIIWGFFSKKKKKITEFSKILGGKKHLRTKYIDFDMLYILYSIVQ